MSFVGDNINAMFGVSNLINTALGISFAFGLMFQVPLITYMLIKFDIIKYNEISSKRPYVTVILLIISALLTPPDVISQLLLFLPTYLLFESGLFFSKIGIKQENKTDDDAKLSNEKQIQKEDKSVRIL